MFCYVLIFIEKSILFEKWLYVKKCLFKKFAIENEAWDDYRIAKVQTRSQLPSTIATKCDLILFGKCVVFIHNIIMFSNSTNIILSYLQVHRTISVRLILLERINIFYRMPVKKNFKDYFARNIIKILQPTT